MTYFIAEICSNHLNNLSRCKKLIDKAKEIGCDAVKFQLFEADKLFCKEVLNNSKDHSNIKKLQLKKKIIPILYNYSKKRKIGFGCSVFDLENLKFLSPYVDFFKIGSYEILRRDLFKKIIKLNKKVIFSTGMASKAEIINIIQLFKSKKFYNFSILRCVSNYPADPNNSNLKSIETLRELTKKLLNKKIKIGWSDHTRNSSVILKAILTYNAEIIEFHLDLDGKGPEYKAGHCWLPNEFKNVISITKNNKMYDGNGKLKFNKSELKERYWRSDPIDGLRPIYKIRKKFKKLK